MNIFFLDQNPQLAAQYQCDKHVVKMILESAQLLCTAHRLRPLHEFPEKFYKATHINHPCSIWTRKCLANYVWLALHAKYLCKEYTYRYNKIHKSEEIIHWCLYYGPNIPYRFVPTEPAQAMPEQYKDEDVVTAYRNYYIEYKMKNIQCRWTKRQPPEWITNNV